MAYKNHEGYLDPTSGQALQNTHWEELQQLREKEHGLKRGQMYSLKCTEKNISRPEKSREPISFLNCTSIVCY